MSYSATFIGQDHKPHTITLPTSFVEFREQGPEELCRSLIHILPHVKYHASLIDKTQWLKDTFSSFETLRRTLLTAAFVLSPLTNIATLLQVSALIGNFTGIFKSSLARLFQPHAENNALEAALARHEKYNYAGNALKLTLFISLPSGIVGLLLFATAWSVVDTICHKAEIMDTSKATDMDPGPMVQAMKHAGSEVAKDWWRDLSQAFNLNGKPSDEHYDSTSGWETPTP